MLEAFSAFLLGIRITASARLQAILVVSRLVQVKLENAHYNGCKHVFVISSTKEIGYHFGSVHFYPKKVVNGF